MAGKLPTQGFGAAPLFLGRILIFIVLECHCVLRLFGELLTQGSNGPRKSHMPEHVRHGTAVNLNNRDLMKLLYFKMLTSCPCRLRFKLQFRAIFCSMTVRALLSSPFLGLNNLLRKRFQLNNQTNSRISSFPKLVKINALDRHCIE